MFDAEEEAGSKNTQRNVWMWLCGIGIIMLMGAIAGFLSQHDEQGGPLDLADVAVLGVLVTVILVLAVSIWKLFQQVKQSGERETRREKLNRNIILACGGLGGVVGVAIASTGISSASKDGTDPFLALLTGPIPLTIVIPLIFVWGVIMPLVAWFWHTRVIDEQEANAYKDGGYYAGYAFLMLAPLWWLLWRGGLLPEPNGVAIYLIFSIIWSAVWFWKKYR